MTAPSNKGKNTAIAIDKEVSCRYDVGELLGTGSYGSVFAAVDKITNQTFAVKVVSRDRLGADGESKMLMEVNIMKCLDHPRILRMVNYIPSERHYNIVMEKVDGGELFNHLLKVKRYTEKKACRVIFNLLRALKHMHDRGLMHCDIKPENLLLVRPPANDEEVTNIKLADFGLATEVKPPNYPTKACGSPLYIAPEVLECGLTKTRKFYTEAADLWSVGIIAYLLVSGMIPFFGKTPNEIFKAVLHTSHNFNHKAWEPVSDLAKDFINMLLVKDPDQRLSCAEALQHEWIQTVVAEEGEDGDRELPETLEGLKKFNAMVKLKGAMYGVEATLRMAYLSRCKKAQIKPNSQVLEVLTSATEPVRVIDLSGNYLGPKGLKVLMSSIVGDHSSKVEEINLKNTLLDDAQLLELASLVYSNGSAAEQKQTTTTTQVTAEALSHGMRQLTETVSSPSTPSTMPARGSLSAEALERVGGGSVHGYHLQNIRSINLSQNELTHASGRVLLDLARMRPTITTIDVSGNHIKDSIIKKIQAQCELNLRGVLADPTITDTSSITKAKPSGTSVNSSRRTSLLQAASAPHQQQQQQSSGVVGHHKRTSSVAHIIDGNQQTSGGPAASQLGNASHRTSKAADGPHKTPGRKPSNPTLFDHSSSVKGVVRTKEDDSRSHLEVSCSTNAHVGVESVESTPVGGARGLLKRKQLHSKQPPPLSHNKDDDDSVEQMPRVHS